MAGFVKHRRKRKTWLRQAPHIQTLTDQLPTSRVSSKNAFLAHCQPAVTHYPVLHQFFGARRCRTAMFANYIGKQQALSKLCRRILGKSRDWFHHDVVVAFGGGRFSSSSRGHASGPIKQPHRQSRRCITRLVNEFRTSQVDAPLFTHPFFYLTFYINLIINMAPKTDRRELEDSVKTKLLV